jgi:hypothetical protein
MEIRIISDSSRSRVYATCSPRVSLGWYNISARNAALKNEQRSVNYKI